MSESGLDFGAEWLLEGCDSGQRADRIALLEQLFADGASLDEIKRAIAEDRLFMLPIERALAGPAIYTARGRWLSAAGSSWSSSSVSATRSAWRGRIRTSGRSASTISRRRDCLASCSTRDSIPRGLLDVARLFGRGLSAGADAVRGLVGRPMMQLGLSERELAMRNAQILDQTLPLTGPLLAYVMRVELLEHIRSEVVGLAEMRAEGRIPAAATSPSASPTWWASRRSASGCRSRSSGISRGGSGSSPPTRSSHLSA